MDFKPQDLLDLSELPAIDETGDYKSAGFTVQMIHGTTTLLWLNKFKKN
ncbi:hypothetical protein [Alkalibacterium gilvum]